MSGHCEHCDSDCKEGKVPWNDIGPYEHYDYGRAWNRPCPVCAERERIVAAIENRCDESLPDQQRAGMMRAADIARGDM